MAGLTQYFRKVWSLSLFLCSLGWLWFLLVWVFFFENWRLGKPVIPIHFLVFSFVSLTNVLIKQALSFFVLDITSSVLWEGSLFCVCWFLTKFQLKPVFLYVQAFHGSCWLKKVLIVGDLPWLRGSWQEGTIQCLTECSESY